MKRKSLRDKPWPTGLHLLVGIDRKTERQKNRKTEKYKDWKAEVENKREKLKARMKDQLESKENGDAKWNEMIKRW